MANLHKHIKSKHHGTLFAGVLLVAVSTVLILNTLNSRITTEADISKPDNKQNLSKVPTVSPAKSQNQTPLLQTKNYNDYGLSFSIPSSWFESENIVTPNLFLTFKKEADAEVVVTTSKSFTGHGVDGELVSKAKITISNLEGEIQIWEDQGKIRSVIVNNLEKDGLFYTFEVFIYQNFETNETEFRDFLKSVKFR